MDEVFDKGTSRMTRLKYMQPVAAHRNCSRRLLLTDDNSRWFLWLGEENGTPVEIPEPLAWYLAGRPELQRLEAPRMWFAVADLPIRETIGSESDAPETGGVF